MKTQLFTIQQFADLHEIGKRTLHFYDQIGLFSPSIKKENGYRYYSLTQGAILEMILTLRELDVPLDVIKAYMDNRTVDSFTRLIDIKQKEIDDKIKELREIKRLLTIKHNQLNIISGDMNRIQIIHCQKKGYAVTPLTNETNYIDAMIEHGKSLPYHLFNMELGTMNHTDHIFNGEYNHTDSIFSNIGVSKARYIRPEGDYIRAFHVGDYENLMPTYIRILEFCNENNIRLIGYSYEVGINDLCVMSLDDYITMIEIQCFILDK